MERPIILKAHEVRGILDGRQTQLRRILKKQPYDFIGGDGAFTVDRQGNQTPAPRMPYHLDNGRIDIITCPYGQVGDRLWGRETWCQCAYSHDGEAETWFKADKLEYWPNGELAEPLWRPSTNMPRHLSRILLEIVSVRVELLQDISDADAMAQGCKAVRDHCHVFDGSGYDKAGLCHGTPKIAFGCFWDDVHGPDSWCSNPWVWVVEFKRVEA